MIHEQEQYPLGKFEVKENYSNNELQQMLLDLETFPLRLEHELQGLLEFQLNTPYREGGWTINQVVHHCADSHMNALLRIKLALTEDNPTISPYKEDLWAELPDYNLPFNNSVTMLFCIHKKLMLVIRNLSQVQLMRTYWHPQYEKSFRVIDVIALYAWHGNHHLEHVKLGIEKSNLNNK